MHGGYTPGVALLHRGNRLGSASVGAISWFSNVYELNELTQLTDCETSRGSTPSGVVGLFGVVASQVVFISIPLIRPMLNTCSFAYGLCRYLVL